MASREYSLKKLSNNLLDIDNEDAWQGIEAIKINNYLWMQNDYRPEVIVKACYSDEYIYVKFLVYETKVKTTYLNVGDPVYKDSCVEFFIKSLSKRERRIF